jgi:hypothetical protein
VLKFPAPTVSARGPHTPPQGNLPTAGSSAGAAPDEFAGLRPRPTRHPLLAAATVALAAFLVFQVRDDVRYALSPATPVDLGDARAVARIPPARMPANRYIRLAGAPDRESALILDNRGSWNFTQFFRLLGTDHKIFVRRVPDPLPVDLAERDVFTGRLVRFRDLSFESSIRGHLATHVSATHFFALAALESALRGGTGPLTVADRLGEQVTLAPEDELAIDTARSDDIQIELPADRFPDRNAARAVVVAQGAEVLSVTATAPDRQTVVARFPAARRDVALTALADIDRRVRIGPARTTTRVRAGDLRPSSQGLSARVRSGGEVFLPRAEIQAVRTLAPLLIPGDAWLLVEGDRPRDHLRDVFVALFLAGFALVNLLAVRRA